MLLSRFVWFFSKHFSTGRPVKRQRRGGKGTEKESERDRSLWVTVALPLHLHSCSAGPLASLWHPVHWGLICLARCLCTLLLLVTFWCHGVTMKWLPSHVAARGGATSGTMRSRGVGAGTQEAPAGHNALTLPPSPAPMKSGISRSVADDKSVSVCPRLFPGPGEDPGWGETETQTQRPRDGSFGGHWGQPVCTALTSDHSRDQTQSHPWHCGRVSRVCLCCDWHGSAEGTEALLPC